MGRLEPSQAAILATEVEVKKALFDELQAPKTSMAKQNMAKNGGKIDKSMFFFWGGEWSAPKFGRIRTFFQSFSSSILVDADARTVVYLHIHVTMVKQTLFDIHVRMCSVHDGTNTARHSRGSTPNDVMIVMEGTPIQCDDILKYSLPSERCQ